jgi:hypothetical protein
VKGPWFRVRMSMFSTAISSSKFRMLSITHPTPREMTKPSEEKSLSRIATTKEADMISIMETKKTMMMMMMMMKAISLDFLKTYQTKSQTQKSWSSWILFSKVFLRLKKTRRLNTLAISISGC